MKCLLIQNYNIYEIKDENIYFLESDFLKL